MDKINDIIDNIKYFFSNIWKKSWNSGWSLFDQVNDFINEKSFLALFILFVWMSMWLFLIYEQYVWYKVNVLNWVVLKENKLILENVKEKRIKESEFFKQIAFNIESEAKYDLWKLVCFFNEYDKNIDYVNRDFKLKKIWFQENNQEFNIEMQWIKHYNSLLENLVWLKQYRTLIDLDDYNIKLESEKVWLWEITYYNIWMRWKIVGINNLLQWTWENIQ